MLATLRFVAFLSLAVFSLIPASVCFALFALSASRVAGCGFALLMTLVLCSFIYLPVWRAIMRFK